MFAIVDIETTGGYAEQHRITEIAIFIHDGNEIVHRFETLINPEVSIPVFIENYTGITNQMVADAPTFKEVSETVYNLLHNQIFVAHNVNFDYNFIKHHLLQAGYHFQTKKLCTVRLSRKLFPGLHSYSLGNLTQALGIPLKNRHRAGGDGEATVLLFEQLRAHELGLAAMDAALKHGSKEAILPPNLPPHEFHQLPEDCGVYYFHDESGKIIYVGKAINIKKRIYGHFSGKLTTAKKQQLHREIKHITYQTTPDELQALILESIEIRKHWPKFNAAQKRKEFPIGIYDYEDHSGYIRLAIDFARKHVTPLKTYKSIAEATAAMQKLVVEFSLCPKLCHTQHHRKKCEAYQLGVCYGACEKAEPTIAYNLRVQAAIEYLLDEKTYAILNHNKKQKMVHCILVEAGKFYGMGSVEDDFFEADLSKIKEHVTPYPNNFFIHELIKPERLSGYTYLHAQL